MAILEEIETPGEKEMARPRPQAWATDRGKAEATMTYSSYPHLPRQQKLGNLGNLTQR